MEFSLFCYHRLFFIKTDVSVSDSELKFWFFHALSIYFVYAWSVPTSFVGRVYIFILI